MRGPADAATASPGSAHADAPVAAAPAAAPRQEAVRGRRTIWSSHRASATFDLDIPSVNLVARIRVALAVGVAATGSFLPSLTREQSALFLIFGLVWVPWATVVFLASARPNSRLALVGGPMGDLVVLFGVQLVAPQAAEVVLLGYVVVVAFAASSGGRALAGGLAMLALVFTVTARYAGSGQDFGAMVLVPFCAALLAIAFLVDRTTTLRARAAVRAQRYRTRAETVLAHVADAVIVTDATGMVLECNPTACTLAGLDTGDMAGLSCKQALGLWSGQRELDCSEGCEILRLSEGADARQGVELWRRDVSGMRQPLLANAAGVPNDAGGTDVVHSLRDVTRIKQAEEAKTLFLATASHELKTPLTVIRGFADVLSDYDSLSDNTRREALGAISARAEHLTQIVERLLLSSRIESGAVSIPAEDMDVTPIVDERVRAVGAATGRHARSTMPKALPRVQGSENALITVVDHLLDNALKYSPGGAPVVVGATADEQWVTITVADGGIGMDPDQVAHCFDKFWQAESTDVRRFGGTGIGLYIVQSLVEAMGGTVTVTSARGEGSTFACNLRRADAPRVPAPPGPAAHDEQGQPGVGEVTSIREFMRQIGIPGRQA
ncbi:MAG TPA: PAS domain-containing sensor histidine kinase [Acidimicrobiales bacterium]|nr:PAS domain-containing sensor histidine kinase [Acidimicrobiales bacterium]